MKINDTLDVLSTIVNRTKAQTIFLFELCGHDMEKYLTLEAKLKSHNCHFVPADVETINAFMENPLKPIDVEFSSSYFVIKNI